MKNSKHLTIFQDYFMPYKKWKEIKEEFLRRAKLPQNKGLILNYLKNRLSRSYDEYMISEKYNFYAKIEFGKWVLLKDSAERNC